MSAVTSPSSTRATSPPAAVPVPLVRRLPALVLLAAEAVTELVRSSVLLAVVPRRRHLRLLGTPSAVVPRGPDRPVHERHTGLDPARDHVARRVGRAVRKTADRLPWKPTCLRRSMAIQRMLHRRGIESELHIGIDGTADPAAHAWVVVGDCVLGDRTTGFTSVVVFDGRRAGRR